MNERYSMSVVWSDEDEGFIARSPEWPGLSAFGETREEAITEAGIALAGMMQIAVDEDMDLPLPLVITQPEPWSVADAARTP